MGAVVGFLFAPEAGEDTRRRLTKRLKTLRDAAEEKVDEVRGLLETDEEDADAEEEAAAPRSTRDELQRRLHAARRRRRAAVPEALEGDEPVA